MKIIIDISERIKQYIDNNEGVPGCLLYELYEAIKESTPLPKGHGRIIDENKISSFGWDKLNNHAVVTAQTIIEADKAESEE